MRVYILALLILIAAIAAGCAQQKLEEKASPTETEKAEVDIAIRDFSFEPDSITIKAGTKVIWTNEDSVLHTVTSEDGIFDSGTLSKGETFSYIFEEAGIYKYTCSIHPSMKGEIIVTE